MQYCTPLDTRMSCFQAAHQHRWYQIRILQEPLDADESMHYNIVVHVCFNCHYAAESADVGPVSLKACHACSRWHKLFDCPAYSHVRSQHLDLLQHCCTIADFLTLCDQIHVVVFLGNALHVGSKCCLFEFTELNFLSIGSQLPPRTFNAYRLID